MKPQIYFLAHPGRPGAEQHNLSKGQIFSSKGSTPRTARCETDSHLNAVPEVFFGLVPVRNDASVAKDLIRGVDQAIYRMQGLTHKGVLAPRVLCCVNPIPVNT